MISCHFGAFVQTLVAGRGSVAGSGVGDGGSDKSGNNKGVPASGFRHEIPRQPAESYSRRR